MRRKDREIKDKNIIESIITRSSVCRLALCHDNIPYIVPMNFGYRDNCLYFHSAKEGKKLDILKKNNNVCFEMDIDHQLVVSDSPCEWGMKYRSVIGLGRAYIVDDMHEKKRALDVIMEHYSGKGNYHYPEKQLKNVTIIKVEIEQLTGKQAGY